MLTEINTPVETSQGRIRRLCSHFFQVASMDDSIRFYRDMMGFALTYQEPRFASMKVGDLEICFQPADGQPKPQATQGMIVTVEVDNVWAFYRRLRDRSVKATEPRTQEWDRRVLITEFSDLNGIHWALIQPTSVRGWEPAF